MTPLLFRPVENGFRFVSGFLVGGFRVGVLGEMGSASVSMAAAWFAIGGRSKHECALSVKNVCLVFACCKLFAC